MTCSTNSFIERALASTRIGRAAAVALALGLAACAHGARPVTRQEPPALRGPFVLRPIVNLSGTSVPAREVQDGVERALRQRGIPLVDGALVDQFLARHRLRYTGGVDREEARAAGEELGAAGLLVTTVELYQPGDPPKAGISMRLVTADDAAQVRWVDAAARAGDDSPGLFELGVVHDYPALQADLLAKLSASLALSLSGKGPHAIACPDGRRFGPKELFRSPRLDAARTWSVAVLPFASETARRNAGDLLALQFVRQLEASGRFHTVEPGVLRDELLRFRIVSEGGISLDNARVILELVQADLVVAGIVRDYEDPTGAGAAPRLQFTVLFLDRANNEVVWESTSYSQGDDGVFFFDAGLVGTTPDLACRMVRSAVDDLLQPGSSPRPLSFPHAAKK